MKRIIGKAFNGAIVFLAHVGLSFIMIAGIQAVEWFIHLTSQGRREMLFDVLPLSYLFQALEVSMVCLYGWMGLKEAYEVMK